MDVDLMDVDFNWEIVGASIQEVLPLYQDPTRHYHNWTHISQCLFESEKFFKANDAPTPNNPWTPPNWTEPLDRWSAKIAIDLAILWHDAIYFPWYTAGQNEEMSAHLWARWARWAFNFNCKEHVVDTVHALIRRTDWSRDHKLPAEPDQDLACVLRDIDFSIMGARRDQYVVYTKRIAHEYSAIVDRVTYAKERRRFLSKIVDSPFQTSYFQEKYGSIATGNICWEMDDLALWQSPEWGNRDQGF